jgi:hypothetical protein
MDKKTEVSSHQKLLRNLPKLLSLLGFSKSTPIFYYRLNEYTIEFVHVHKFSFTSSYRIHFGIRVINDSFDAIHLNGPDSTKYTTKKFIFRKISSFNYNETPESIEECAHNIYLFCEKIGEPWFSQWRRPENLLSHKNSPLSIDEKKWLSLALQGQSESRNVNISKGLFKVT